jgi:hypothetical protein
MIGTQPEREVGLRGGGAQEGNGGAVTRTIIHA